MSSLGIEIHEYNYVFLKNAYYVIRICIVTLLIMYLLPLSS